MANTAEDDRPLDLEGQVIIDEDRHDDLETKAALAEELEGKLESAKQTLREYEEHLDIANGAFAAALASEGPHSEAVYQDASFQAKRRELARLRGTEIAALAQYGTGDVVSYGQGEKKTGVVIEVLTSDTEVPKSGEMVEVEASSDSPKYVVALGHTSGVDIFNGSDLSSGSIDVDDLESSTKELKDDTSAANELGHNDEEAALDFTYPKAWRQSSKPNRLILLDAWASMGGSFSACYPEYGGKRFCASMKDKVYGTTRWRKGG